MTVLNIAALVVAVAAAIAAFWQAREASKTRIEGRKDRDAAERAAQDAEASRARAAEAARQSARALTEIADAMRPPVPWQLRWVPNAGTQQEVINRTGHRVEAILMSADPDADDGAAVERPGWHDVEPDASIRFHLPPGPINEGTFALTVLWGHIGASEKQSYPITAYYDRRHRYPES